MIHWLQHHLLPCPFKHLTGIDCPGCGFQRSVIELLQGNFKQSFLLYPPAIPILLVMVYYYITLFKVYSPKYKLLNPLLVVLAFIILVNYSIKLSTIL